MKRYLLLACFILLTLTACEKPRLDPINEQRIEASLTRMRESLDDAKRAQLDRAMKRVALIEAAKRNSTGGLVTGAFGENYKPQVSLVQAIAHKTADEIIEFARYDSSHAQKMRDTIKDRIADRTAHLAKVEAAIEPAKAELQAMLDRKGSGDTTWEGARDIHLSGTTLGPRLLHGPDCKCIGFNFTIDNQSEHTLTGLYARYVIKDAQTGKRFEASGLNIYFADSLLDGPSIVRPGETLTCRLAVKGEQMLLPKDLSGLVWEPEITALTLPGGSAVLSSMGTDGLDAGIERATAQVKQIEANRQNAIDAIRHLQDAAAILNFSQD